MALSYLLEFFTNLHFGNWIVRSRYIEHLLDKLGGIGESSSSLQNVGRLTLYITPALTILLLSPQMYYVVSLRRNEPLMWAYSLVQACIYSLNLIFLLLWLWLCYECYKYNTKYIELHFAPNIVMAETVEDRILISRRAMQTFVDNITLMQEISSPWTVSMIIRLLCNIYRFWCILKVVVMPIIYYTDGDVDVDITNLVTSILSLISQIGLMLVVTFASGYVGDIYVHEVVKGLRYQISQEQSETVSRAMIEFLMLANNYKGEAGLLFCGVEMGTEKGIYLATALTYINAYFIVPSGQN